MVSKKLQACQEPGNVSLASGSSVTPEVALSGPDVRVETRDAEKETEFFPTEVYEKVRPEVWADSTVCVYA